MEWTPCRRALRGIAHSLAFRFLCPKLDVYAHHANQLSVHMLQESDGVRFALCFTGCAAACADVSLCICGAACRQVAAEQGVQRRARQPRPERRAPPAYGRPACSRQSTQHGESACGHGQLPYLQLWSTCKGAASAPIVEACFCRTWVPSCVRGYPPPPSAHTALLGHLHQTIT